MSTLLLLLVLFLVTPSLVFGAGEQTSCTDQLYNYYRALGMPSSQERIKTILFFTGNDAAGTPYVNATFQFQAVARIYHLAANLTGIPYVSYVSYDKPWCVGKMYSNCSLTKEGRYTLAKNTTCPIIDFDAGGTVPIAGRFYAYANQTTACNGSVTVTFLNVTLEPEPGSNPLGNLFPWNPFIPNSGNDHYQGNYIYDAFGITNTTLMTPAEALYQYRKSPCDYTTGNDVAEIFNDRQFVCMDRRIGCSTERPFSLPTKPVIPIARFGCYHNDLVSNSSGNYGSQYMIWHVYSLQIPQGQEGFYQLQIMDSDHTGNYYAGLYDPLGVCWWFLISLATDVCTPFVLLPSTRRQHKSDFGLTFDSTVLVGYELEPLNFIVAILWRAAKEIVIEPEYSYSADQIIEMIPCVCDFSMDCTSDGVIDTEDFQHFIDVKNKAPVSVVKPSETTIAVGETEIILYSNSSYDPDTKPAPFLTYYWKVYNITDFQQSPLSGKPMIQMLSDPTHANCTLNLTGVRPGLYAILLYVSDGEKVSHSFGNITILPNIVTSVAGNDFAVKMMSCNATYEGYCIPLNGSLTYESDESYTIYYNWTQILGFNLWPPTIDAACGGYSSGLFDYTKETSCFKPRYPGLYQFNLTAYDNISSTSWSILYVNVLPGPLDHDAPPGDPYLFSPPPRRIDPPLGHPQIEFPYRTPPPFVDFPVVPLEETPTEVPTLFPSYPSTSNEDFFTILLVGGVALGFVVIFAAIKIALSPSDEYNHLDRVQYRHIG